MAPFLGGGGGCGEGAGCVTGGGVYTVFLRSQKLISPFGVGQKITCRACHRLIWVVC